MTTAAQPRRPRRRRRILLGLLLVWVGFAAWHTQKPLPTGVHVNGRFVAAPDTAFAFLADVTARDAAGVVQRQQTIHAATMELVRTAREFLVLDYFLFNGQGGPKGPLQYGDGIAPVSRELIDALRELKTREPTLPVLVITDPINDYYRGTAPADLAALETLGIDVVVTKLDGLRDSNPLYSTTWRLLFQWWAPTRGEGRLPNLLDGAGPDVRLGALLRLPNFKANHRKVVITADGTGSLTGIVASANPHDASSAHSNVALRLGGEALRPLLESELAIARASGWSGSLRDPAAPLVTRSARDGSQAIAGETAVRTAVLTEGAIRTALLERFATTTTGDAIDIAQFYLADRGVIRALIDAANRGVAVRVLLDPNRDAFGFEKSGIPNRSVGDELLKRTDRKLQLRWYRTNGEQFHAKLASVHTDGWHWFTLGSANFTRRNIGDLNLEANVVVDAHADDAVALQVRQWFERLWTNADGLQYSSNASEWTDASRLRYWQYRVMEASGLSTF